MANISKERPINQLEIFKTSLPNKPYCVDFLPSPLKIRSLEHAIKHRHIQPNSPTDLKWLVYDVDRSTSKIDWYDLDAPPPNIIATNPANGHSHLFYGLEIPVHTQHTARKNPLRYAAAIDIALIRKLDSDPDYGRLIAKNPLHKDWIIETLESRSYDLELIADYLDLKPYSDKRKNLPDYGLGRNCNLFNFVRLWAYREIRKPQGYLSIDFFYNAVYCKAYSYNLTFNIPLQDSEVKATAKSIAKWVWANMSPQGFNLWGTNRRKKSLKVRQSKAQTKAVEVLSLLQNNPRATQKELSRITGIPRQTIQRLLNSKISYN